MPRHGWAGIKNGDLLASAEKEFDAFITVDRKLAKQQDLTEFDIAVVLIRSRSNRLEDIRPLVPELLGAISRYCPPRPRSLPEKVLCGATLDRRAFPTPARGALRG